MKNNIPKQFKKAVKDLMRKHCWNMGVSNYLGDILYMESDRSDNTNSDVHAEMTVDRRYLSATLKVYPIAIRKFKQDGMEYLDHLIAHEVAHIVTQHVMDLLVSCYKDEGETKDAWESLTETIGRMSSKIKH